MLVSINANIKQCKAIQLLLITWSMKDFFSYFLTELNKYNDLALSLPCEKLNIREKWDPAKGIKCKAHKSIDYLNLRKQDINIKLQANPILNVIKLNIKLKARSWFSYCKKVFIKVKILLLNCCITSHHKTCQK